ncbi:Diadenylate cyclase (c-di-AMP synthetase), DisA_N domain [Halanaeroarchaeum sp. HSR-CO]|uniref:diadenylate cyclase DacZ n=1 Tax=Halanaeroarchaeum sp. HSR-CO TaxID=2866382 RepID=UPI00217D4A98|nr:diadenylate cyclase DacZ [Halanaeroarchaeum sp. HSR-CO]UWG48340.1 Diadenylate cyclase (c-di-AMP synthetase), DisA_N domain [Halanaeroarchaeum sp. HSR-CO]
MAGIRDLFDPIVSDVDVLFLFSPSSSYYETARDIENLDLVVVDDENAVDAATFVKLPLSFSDIREQIRFGLEGALDRGHIEDGAAVAIAAPLFGDEIDMMTRTRADQSKHTGIYDLFVKSRAEPGVIRNVFEVAIELGRKGQKGKPVGALFVVGDAGKVMNKSRPLSYNPFEKSHVHVGDPIVNVMLKEFSRLDGAFIISDSGKIVSAYRYLEPSAEGVDIPKGLGARHMAAGAITRDTNAIAIVLSESDGMVRAFKSGELILELDPEEY